MSETQRGDPSPDVPPAATPASAADPRRWRRDAGVLALLFLSVVAVTSPTLVHHVRLADDSNQVNDDARGQIPPFLKYRYPETFKNDYAARYFLDSYPLGYKSLMAAASRFKDPRWLSKALPYPMLLGLTLLVGVAGWRVGGRGAAWVSMALVLTSEVFIERMTGGLARTFAFPVVALAALALAYGRAYWLAAAALVGAAFYPAAGALAGIALATLLLAVPRRDRGDAAAWGLVKRAGVVGATASLCAAIYLPTALATRQYGPLLGAADAKEYPELAPRGRLGHRDRPPFKLGAGIRDAAMRALSGPRRTTGFLTYRGEKIYWRSRLWVAYALAVAAAIALACCKPEGRRLATLAVAAVVGFTLAKLVHPQLYLPERYTLFAIPIFIAIALPAGLVVLARKLIPTRVRARRITLVAVFSLVLLSMGIGMRTAAGFSHQIEGDLAVLRFVKQLPPDAVVAGWPTGVMDDLPYQTERQAFLNHEIHLVFHKSYADAMRARTEALIDAYFATDVRPLLRLRDDFGVTHLIVDRRHYGEAPDYFAPFDKRIADRFGAMRRDGAETMRHGRAILFKGGSFYGLDLSKLDMSAPVPATQPAPR